MALDSTLVSNSIISEVLTRQGLDSSGNIAASNLVTFLSKREINTIIASKISTYLLANLKIECNYTGLLTNGSPDPNNGQFYLSVAEVPLTGEIIELKSEYSSQQSSGEVPKNDWVTSIVVSLRTIVFKLTNSIITVTGSPLFLANMLVPNLPTSANFKDNIANLVSVLFSSIESAIPTPPTLPSTSTSAGAGVSTLLTFE